MFPTPRPTILDIEPYVAGESKIPGVNRIIKLSSNEGPFGPPPSAIDAMARAATEGHRYPDGGSGALRAAIGKAHGLDPARIVCGTGSDELISHLCLAYGGAGTEVLMSAHGFTMYDISGKYAGSHVVKAPERNLTTDVDALLARVSPATRLLFIANPNNPTGTLLPQSEVERLRAGLPENVLLVLDAAYAEYVTELGYDAGAKLVDATPNTVMLRTFSKIYGLGGLRVGWAYAPAPIIDVMNRIRGVFNINSIAQAGAVAALGEAGWLEKNRTHNSQWRAWMIAALEKIGIRCVPSHGNFFLADFGSPEGATEADAFLRSRGLIVRAMRGYGLPQMLRISIGTGEECELLAEALGVFMQTKNG